jgi:hypothetical protein
MAGIVAREWGGNEIVVIGVGKLASIGRQEASSLQGRGLVLTTAGVAAANGQAVEVNVQHRGRVPRRDGSLRRPSDRRGRETIGILRLGDAAILVVTVDNAVQLVTCHPADTATSALQVRDKSGQKAEGLATAAVQCEQLGLVPRGGLVPQVGLDTDKAPIAVLAPEV